MWYFSWILGLGLAASFAIFNAMWFELRNDVLVRAKASAAPKVKLNEQADAAGKGQKV